MEFLKKHWQKIVAALFVVLFFSTCTSNCSHKNEIRKKNAMIELEDETICMLADSIEFLNSRIDELNAVIDKQNTTIELVNKSNSDLNNALNRNVVVNIKQQRDEN